MELEQFDPELTFENVSAKLKAHAFPEDCMFQLRNGSNGREFEHRTFVGRVFVMRLHHHPEDKLSWQNQIRADHAGLAVTGIGNVRYGREEAEILYQHDVQSILQEMIVNNKKTNTGSKIRELVKVLGYEYEF